MVSNKSDSLDSKPVLTMELLAGFIDLICVVNQRYAVPTEPITVLYANVWLRLVLLMVCIQGESKVWIHQIKFEAVFRPRYYSTTVYIKQYGIFVLFT